MMQPSGSSGAVGPFYRAASTAMSPVGTPPPRTAIGGSSREADERRSHGDPPTLREQTGADQQRRLTESFSRAVEQQAGNTVEARLGGIYMLERSRSKRSPMRNRRDGGIV